MILPSKGLCSWNANGALKAVFIFSCEKIKYKVQYQMHCKLAVSACYLGNNIFTLTIEFANKKVLKTVVKN